MCYKMATFGSFKLCARPLLGLYNIYTNMTLTLLVLVPSSEPWGLLGWGHQQIMLLTPQPLLPLKIYNMYVATVKLCVHICTQTHTNKHTHVHTQRHTNADTDTHTFIHTHIHNTCTHTMRTHVCMHADTNKHTHTHMLTNAHICTHTHTNLYSVALQYTSSGVEYNKPV